MTNKLKSRKFIIVLWAMLSFTAMGIVAVVTGFDAPWMSGSMLVLAGIPGAYVGIGQAKKKAEK